MLYLVLAILCSVAVSINLKLLKRYYTDAYQAIVFNYPTAVILCLVFFTPNLSTVPSSQQSLLYLLIAFLMISIFYFISKSIATAGIVRTAIAQRLSLIIPVFAAFLIFNESINSLKILGLAVGFAAIYTSIPSASKSKSSKSGYWYALIVFAGTGIIDIFFNMLTQYNGIPFTQSLFYIFCIATVLGMGSLAYQKATGKLKFQTKALFAGIVLGVLNFGSIYFYIKALATESTRPSVIFSALDIGVIALGSLVGLFLFKERLTGINKFGLVLAVIAICILTFA